LNTRGSGFWEQAGAGFNDYVAAFVPQATGKKLNPHVAGNLPLCCELLDGGVKGIQQFSVSAGIVAAQRLTPRGAAFAEEVFPFFHGRVERCALPVTRRAPELFRRATTVLSAEGRVTSPFACFRLGVSYGF
jgi:hypothetical protein